MLILKHLFPALKFMGIEGEGAGGGAAAPAAGTAGAAAPAAGAGAPAVIDDPNRAGYNPGGGAAPAAAAPAGPTFESLVPAEFKEKPWVKETKDLPTLFKRVDDLQSELGKRPSAIPQETAKPEEWQKFNKAFGVPDKPEDYKFSAPPPGLESNAEFQTGIQKILHEAGVSARQFKAIEPAWNALQLQMAKNTQAGALALDADFDKISSTVFGERKDKAIAGAKSLMDQFTPAVLKPHIGSLSNEALVIMAGILDGVRAKFISEDHIPSGTGDGGGTGGGEAARREEARKIMASPEYNNPFHPDNAKLIEKVKRLYQPA